MKDFEVEFLANKPTIEIIAGKDGKKKAIITGTLMNTEFNENDWRILAEDGEKIANQFKGNPLKLQHSPSDLDIYGEGVEANFDSNVGEIYYKSMVSNPEAVKKFETGEWSENNMGVSPKMRHNKIECSVCGEDIRKCNHTLGEIYDKKRCQVTLHSSHLVEHSLTSDPAYKGVGAGNINYVMMAAIKGGKMEEKEKKDFEAKIKEKEDLVAEKEKVIAEKEGEIEDLNDKVNKLTKKAEDEANEKGEGEDEKEKGGEEETTPEKPPEEPPEEGEKPEEKLKAVQKEIQAKTKELEVTKTKLDAYVRAERQEKLEKVFDKEEQKELIS